tara:strand:- start:43 stop:273 length:231 start_codon:yes stop_codon:yes gene_type:complete
MPRKQKRPEVEPIRRKCFACGKVRLVVFREWKIPPTKFNPTKGSGPLRKDIPGAVVNNYCCFPNSEDGTFECGYNG